MKEIRLKLLGGFNEALKDERGYSFLCVDEIKKFFPVRPGEYYVLKLNKSRFCGSKFVRIDVSGVFVDYIAPDGGCFILYGALERVLVGMFPEDGGHNLYFSLTPAVD